jgi:hypothetical protein
LACALFRRRFGYFSKAAATGKLASLPWVWNATELQMYWVRRDYMVRLLQQRRSQWPHTLPPLPHFANQVAANGKVYVGTNNSRVVFGLLWCVDA